MTNVAICRRSDVVSRVEGDETLVLDLQSQTAHCLSGDVAAVWNAEGVSLDAISSASGLSGHAVGAAVDTLVGLGLVTLPAGLSRRTLVRRAAVVGGAVATTIALPTAAMASSNVGTPAITLSENTGPMGWVLTISGVNFKTSGGHVASVTFNSQPVSFSATTITGGSFSGLTITVPTGLTFGNTYTIVVKDNAGTPNQAQASYTVMKPAFTASHPSKNNSPGTFTVSVTSPFAPNASTTAATSGGFTLTSPTSVTTTSAGLITDTFHVTYGSGNQSGTVTFNDGINGPVSGPLSA